MKKGEIWLCDLPLYDGHEQRGIRPGIFLTDPYLDIVTLLPLTSNLEALRFENTLKIIKNQDNQLERDSVALVFQIISIDIKRGLKKIGKLDKKQEKIVETGIRKYLRI